MVIKMDSRNIVVKYVSYSYIQYKNDQGVFYFFEQFANYKSKDW